MQAVQLLALSRQALSTYSGLIPGVFVTQRFMTSVIRSKTDCYHLPPPAPADDLARDGKNPNLTYRQIRAESIHPAIQMSGRPELNNKELIARAMATVLEPLQMHVIAEMKLRYGTNWWNEKIMPDRLLYGLKDDAPTQDDLPDDIAIGYLDAPRCIKIIDDFQLLPKAVRKGPVNPLRVIRDLRNSIFHDGNRDYSTVETQDAIRRLIIVDEVLELGCQEELNRLLDAVTKPMENGIEPAPPGESPEEPPEEVPDDRKPKAADQCPEPQFPKRAPRPAPVDTKSEVGNICRMACDGLNDQLLEPKYLERRTSVHVREIKPKGDYILLTLDGQLIMDDSLAISVDGREFSGAQVGFSSDSGVSTSFRVYPCQELRELLEAKPEGVQVFTDTRWMIDRTLEFFNDYGGAIRYPPTPMKYERSQAVSSMRMTDEQRAAVDMALSEPLSYVWGVPGSGKTQSVLAASICESVRRDGRVAIIAPTNVALEQILRGLSSAFEANPALKSIIDPERDIIRIGTPTYLFAKDYPNLCEAKTVRREIADRQRQIDQLETTLHERRYESRRPDVEDAMREAEGKEDQRSADMLYGALRPLLRSMSEDRRYRFVAGHVRPSNVLSVVDGLYNLVYGHDRAMYLESSLKDQTDDEIAERARVLRGEVESLTPRAEEVDLGSVKVIAMTLTRFVISFGPWMKQDRRSLDVGHVFVDEAGYCNLVQTAALFTLGVPVTLLGDHMQLPPVCEVDRDDILRGIEEGGLYRNNFLWDMPAIYSDELLSGAVDKLADDYKDSLPPSFPRTAKTNLSTTFRFGPNLADILRRFVYPEGIRSASGDPLDITVLDAHIDKFPIRDEKNDKALRRNTAEAERLLAYIREKGLGDEDFVVLTPYRAQKTYLEGVDRGRLRNNVMTIHRSQGREWDTVIISVVDCRANPSGSPPRFTSSRRTDEGNGGLLVINTALSRAKSHLVIVCDTDYWGAQQGELLGEIVRENYRPRSAFVPVHEPVGDQRPLAGQRDVVEAPVVRVPLHEYQPVGGQLRQVVPAVLLLGVELRRHGLVGHLMPRPGLPEDVDQDVPGLALDRREVGDVRHGDLLELLAHGLVRPPVDVVDRGADEERAGARCRGHEVRPSGDVYRERHALRVLLVVDAADRVHDLLEVEPGDVLDRRDYLELPARVGHVLGHAPEPVARQQVYPVDPGAYRVYGLGHRLRRSADGGYVDVHGNKFHLTILEFSHIHHRDSMVTK